MSYSQQQHSISAPPPSLLRAWCYLVLLSWRRQARARQMVWIALGLLAFTTAMTAVATAADLWHRPRFRQLALADQMMFAAIAPGSPAQALGDAALGAARVAVQTEPSAAQVFARWVVAAIFLGFL
jgi:hypothetical protein